MSSLIPFYVIFQSVFFNIMLLKLTETVSLVTAIRWNQEIDIISMAFLYLDWKKLGARSVQSNHACLSLHFLSDIIRGSPCRYMLIITSLYLKMNVHCDWWENEPDYIYNKRWSSLLILDVLYVYVRFLKNYFFTG